MSHTVAVAGASGYAGGELLRLLAGHPEFEVRTVTAHENAGMPVTAVHPHLHSYSGLEFAPTSAETLAGHDVVFLALPHGRSGAIADSLAGIPLIVDCGADHRLTDADQWAAFYGGEFHPPWAYGLPELPLAAGGTQRSALSGARRIAVPGCNVTAITLGLAPGIRDRIVMADDIVAVLAVGTSGAGRSLRTELLASEIHGSAGPYAVGGVHRHVPEIRQNLGAAGARNVTVSFTPVLVPMSRGILATSTARLAPGIRADEVRESWEAAYGHETFVRLLPEGSFPKTADVLGSNLAAIGIAVDEAAGRVVAVTAIDNLVKGTAGAAIQSANLAVGLPETAGLPVNGVAP
ncbi:N-acetyl-gamma-glutamyl-phosphate reductase [Cryobacterium mesophilum]|uniref:N-acetyl-gamma-glutamyl-phosphate reductase n=1 Tax=Terrimesophilobacter mesophilus TaxID=433647 RepID=A0A4R8V794_9MICO|nr:N-acetyl-gamma-glutamyl-phosphate reductase [Terrimesophilobacter mesophilus]MBB5632121.1 N-acetyl-gamma-glutamyl-phosphate reductase [Terrimesophilobacter mesophilus]TFB78991.1 N-acetyl-gamma-glutamyl-phosphate reductase [Terrimesophilobacter mesophilus]